MKYIDSKPVNTGRQPEMDLFKTACIVFMILSHVMLDLSVIESSGSDYGFIDYLICIVGAASFMICMGIGMRYSRNQSPAKYMARGIGLLTVGQFLNLLRNALPNLIAWWVTGKQIFIANSLLVIQPDILSFAGLAFLLMALLKKLKLSDGSILAVGFGMNLLGLIMYYIVHSTGFFPLSMVMGFFFISDAECYFPLFCYFVFVAFGYFVGGYYPRIRDKDGLSTLILLVCVPICTIYYALRILVPFPILPELGSDLQYSMVPATDAVGACLITLILLAFLYKISRLFKGDLPGFLTYPAEHINGFYCVSYILILPVQTLVLAVKGQLFENEIIPFVYYFIVMFLTWLIIRTNEKYIRFDVARLKGKKLTIFFAAVWILTIAVVVYAYPRIDTFATMWNEYLLPK